MDNQPQSISSQATVSALAGMLFFAPLVKRELNKENSFSEYEKNFILWYTQIGFVNLTFLCILICVAIINMFFDSSILSWIDTIVWYAIFIISVFCSFTCIWWFLMWEQWESIMQPIQHKWEILKSYTPILNFSLWFRQTDYSMPYRWLKESVLLRSCFIALTLLLWSYVGVSMLVIIVVRVLLLMMNIDIIPINMKKNINTLFSCQPWEMITYLSASIREKLKKEDYQTVLQSEKERYIKWSSFWANIVIQYVLFIWLLILLYHNIDVSVMQIVLAVALLLFIIKTFIFYKNKNTLPCIPILSEIVSLIIK